MADPAVPEQPQPVFRLVADTRNMSQADRYVLSARVGLLAEFSLAEALKRHAAEWKWTVN